jgi:hypothetical protein
MPVEYEDYHAIDEHRRRLARAFAACPARVIRGVFTDHKRAQIIEHWRKRGERAVFPDCPAPPWAYA